MPVLVPVARFLEVTSSTQKGNDKSKKRLFYWLFACLVELMICSKTALQAGCHRFESVQLHQRNPDFIRVSFFLRTFQAGAGFRWCRFRCRSRKYLSFLEATWTAFLGSVFGSGRRIRSIAVEFFSCCWGGLTGFYSTTSTIIE